MGVPHAGHERERHAVDLGQPHIHAPLRKHGEAQAGAGPELQCADAGLWAVRDRAHTATLDHTGDIAGYLTAHPRAAVELGHLPLLAPLLLWRRMLPQAATPPADDRLQALYPIDTTLHQQLFASLSIV